jgi:hypothetical protein
MFDIVKKFNSCVRLDSNDIAFTYHETFDNFMVFNKQEMHTQMKQWRDLLKSGDIYILEENNKTFTINGVSYYCIIIQGCEVTMSKCGLLFDECYLVDGFYQLDDGFFYMFRTKETRDTVFNWLIKYCQIKCSDDDTYGECNICFEEGGSLVTRCCNKDICSECVKNKRKSSCPFCRKEY